MLSATSCSTGVVTKEVETGGKSNSISFSWILFHFTILTYLILFIFLSLSSLT